MVTIEYYPIMRKITRGDDGKIIEQANGVVEEAEFETYLINKKFVKTL